MLFATFLCSLTTTLTPGEPSATRAAADVISPIPAPNFAGQWMTNFGPMSLRKKGKSITGTCGYDDGIKLSGKLKRNGSWIVEAKGHQRGEGSFALWKGGDQFSGVLQLKGGGERKWRGYRLEAKLPKPVAGKIVHGQCESGLNLHLRVPKGFKKSRPLPAVLLLHGSNMSSSAYVNTFAAAWPKLSKRVILVGLDGENLSAASKPGRLAFNYSYVNFSGPGQGPEWVQRQSPALVADAMDELSKALPIENWIVGGHSQGGFLTYAIAMFYPEKIVGAFPMSCGLLTQCEPDNFGDKRSRDAQRKVAFAPIHAENDGVVEFSSGQYGFRRFADEEFSALRFFTDARAAHMFARLPADDAVRWILDLTTTDPKQLHAWALARIEDGGFRDACAALVRLRAMEGGEDAAKALASAIDGAAAPRAKPLLESIRKNRDAAWIDDFIAFRQDFEFSDAAAPVMNAFGKMRKKHARPAEAAFKKARSAKDAATRKGHYRDIVEKFYASKWFVHAREWMK